MNRIALSLLLAATMFLLVPPKSPAVLPAVAPAAIYAAEFLGGYLVGKAILDPLWDRTVGGDERVTELDRRLLSYESMLRHVDSTQANAIAELRRSLDTKTTADDVRAIVNDTLGKLRDRVQEVEGRLTDAEKRTLTLEKRVQAIEDLFGRITYFPPTPLVMREGGDDAKPAPHPRIKEWLTLLVRSEESRIKLIELKRDYADSSEEVKKATQADRKLVEESQTLHKSALEAVAGGLMEINVFKPGSLKRLPEEAKLAGQMWLVAVTRPVGEGEGKGRLGVPPALFGAQACEVVEAFDLSGVQLDQVVGLYRRGLAAEYAARKPVYSPSSPGEIPRDGLKKCADAWRELLPQLRKVHRQVLTIDAQHRATAKEYGPRHEKMIAVEKQKRTQVAEMKEAASKVERVLQESIHEYIKAVAAGERPTNGGMTAYRERVLAPLYAWEAVLRCEDSEWKEPTLVKATWVRFQGSAIQSSDFIGTLKGHTGSVLSVAYSPDGQRLVTGSGDNTAKVWDAKTGTELLTLKGHTHYVNSVAYSPDGQRLVTGSDDKTAKVWDAKTGTELLPLKGHTDFVFSVAYSPDGQRLVTGSADKTAKVWDVDTLLNADSAADKKR